MRVCWKLHKKFESVVEKNSKKLSEHAHLLGSSEERRYANACNYANSWIYVYMQTVLINLQNV